MTEPIIVRWCTHCGEDQREEYHRGVLIEVLKDRYGLYARVDDGRDGHRLIDLWRFDRDSYRKAQAAYPQLWASENTSE